MRDVNEIITRNVLYELEHSAKRGEQEGLLVDRNVIAARMAEFAGWELDSTKKGLARYIDRGNPWRIDYVEAFARAVGKDVAYMVQPHNPKGVREHTPYQVLIAAVGARMKGDEPRDLARRLNQLLDHRPFYDLAIKLIDAILSGENADKTAVRAMDLVRASAAWKGKRRNLRGKKKSDKKS